METTETTYQLYKDIIGVRLPWIITAVEKDEKERKITIRIEHGTSHKISCPVCSAEAKAHDHRVRVLRYLDTCQYETFLEVHVPRVKCEQDGVQQIEIPYAEKYSRFTSRFECAVILWLQDSPISAVAENFKSDTPGKAGGLICEPLKAVFHEPPKGSCCSYLSANSSC